jgi:hypothetical protein
VRALREDPREYGPATLEVSAHTFVTGLDATFTAYGTVSGGGSEVELQEIVDEYGRAYSDNEFGKAFGQREVIAAEQALIDEACKRWAAWR